MACRLTRNYKPNNMYTLINTDHGLENEISDFEYESLPRHKKLLYRKKQDDYTSGVSSLPSDSFGLGFTDSYGTNGSDDNSSGFGGFGGGDFGGGGASGGWDSGSSASDMGSIAGDLS